MVVTSIAKPTWLLFAIYSSPWFAERRLLWENLESVVNLHSMPWVITGDFNEVLMGDDKLGGSSINISRALQFQECLDTYRMINIGFSGPRYNWSNRKPFHQLVQERIDRVFVNVEWNSILPEAAVFHLEKVQLNHCPIKLCSENNRDFHPPLPQVFPFPTDVAFSPYFLRCGEGSLE